MREMGANQAGIILLSGGLDSATCLAIARAEVFSPLYSMSFDYGQRHRHELAAAENLSRIHGVREHRVIQISDSLDGGLHRDECQWTDGSSHEREWEQGDVQRDCGDDLSDSD